MAEKVIGCWLLVVGYWLLVIGLANSPKKLASPTVPSPHQL
jgi:hypothetical protein